MKSFLFILLLFFSVQEVWARKRIWFWHDDSVAYWNQVAQFLKQSAESLDLTAETFSSANDMSKAIDDFSRRANKNKFDLIVFQSKNDLTKKFLDIIEAKQVPAISLGKGELDQSLGRPGETYKSWMAHIRPNNKRAGLLQAEGLYQFAQGLGHEQVKIVVLMGTTDDQESSERFVGLEEWLSGAGQGKGEILTQINLSSGGQKSARGHMSRLWRRGVDFQVVWTANRDIAVGVLEAAKEVGEVPGKDFVLGTVGLDQEIVDLILAKKLTLSVLGSEFTSILATLYAYDFFQSIPPSAGDVAVDMSVLSINEVKKFKQIFKDGHFENFPFKSLSKSGNTLVATKGYDLTLKNFFK